MTRTMKPRLSKSRTASNARSRVQNPVIMAFKFDPEHPNVGQHHVTVCTWTPDALKITTDLKAKLPRNANLPTRDLRFRTQVRDTGVIRTEDDLGLGYHPQPLLYTRSEPDIARMEANAAVAVWAGKILKTQGNIDQRLARELEDLALDDKAVQARHIPIDVYGWEVNRLTGSTRKPKNSNLYADLADYAGSLLEGKEIYPEAGPMRRVVTDNLRDGETVLMTDVMTRVIDDVEIRFSLGLEISVETYPARALPVLQVKHKKFVWAREPKEGLRNLSGYILPHGETRALKFRVNPDLSLDEGWQALADNYGLPFSTTETLAMNGAYGLAGGHVIVINHQNGRAESNAALRGIPVIDARLSFERLEELLAPHGLTRWTGIEEVPSHYGEKNDADMAWKILFEDDDDTEPRPTRGKKPKEKSAATLEREREKAQVAFDQWITRVRDDINAHYGKAHHIILGYGPGLREDAEQARDILQQTLQDKAVIKLQAIPAGTHGSRWDLDGGRRDMKTVDRAASREQAWTPFVQEVREYASGRPDLPVTGVIIMADLWYKSPRDGKNRKDDPLNKRAARLTLNRQLNLMVQYLLPRARLKTGVLNDAKTQNFRIRTINAWRDLAWKSIGKMNAMEEKIRLSFDTPPSDPRALTLLGVGIIRLNRKRSTNNVTSFIPYAIELDPQSGTCMGTLLLSQGSHVPVRTPMLPLPELVHELNANGPSYLVRRRNPKETMAERRALTQQFLHRVIAERASNHPGLIVLADAGTLSGIWPWLADENIDPRSVPLDDEPNALMDFPDAAILRIRPDHAPKVLKDSDVDVVIDGEIRPASTWSSGDLYRVTDTGDGMQTYLSFGSRIFKGRRTRSAYRDMIDGKGEVIHPKNDAWITPNAIEVTVVRPGTHTPDELAKFVEALRTEFAHFGSWINSPGPLHFASLLKEYTPDYELAEAEEDEQQQEEQVKPMPSLFDFMF
ncbi:RNaseH domain-containing protein [Deinococcus aestuarii]|uniref:RNaseH domain-containing protein n=1 Tax=Deinococcus aestuarii TaxID=2774531 RepID=UPI001C0AE6CB|nr:RNaseH domain-containing protein [Deinococcus aestuarii]